MLHVQVRKEEADPVIAIARKHGARKPAAVSAGDSNVIVFVTLPNDAVGAFVEAVTDSTAEAHFVMLPIGALPLQTPIDEVADSVQDVSRLSTLELVLASLQSVGSWRGLLIFSVLAGLIGAYSLIFDASYLLVAAMLINPMGAPAMVAVTGMAIGDAKLFGRGGVRFVISLAVQALAAVALGLAYGLTVSTAMMEQVTSLSNWAALVAFAAGAAGAISKVKSDRDSLVSGTAAGFMVAAALAPPAAVLGLALALGRADYMGLMGFLLGLQFVAISLGGWTAFRLFGVRPVEPSIGRGRGAIRTVLVAGVATVTLGLVAWQSTLHPRYLRADLSRTALEIARDAADRTDGAYLIESAARFTRRDLDRYQSEGLLMEVVIENTGGRGDDALKAELRRHLQDLLASRMDGVVGFFDITVVPRPPN